MLPLDTIKRTSIGQKTPLTGAWEFMPHIINHSNWTYDLKNLHKISRHNEWIRRVNFERELDHGNKAVVITGPDQVIQYVNFYFEKMTGYNRDEALGRIPKFLQGPETDPATRYKIKQGLENHEEIRATIVNYRKDQQKYLCRVKIIPLFNKDKVLVNYMAIEREVAA